MTKQASTTESPEENLETWIQWKADTAREIARLTEKNQEHEVAHNGSLAALAMGWTRGQEARNRELRSGHDSQNSDEKGKTTSTMVLNAS